MQLPGRLRTTSLGDLLGALHRACATGTLELIEDSGRTHRVHVARGLVVAAELDGPSPSLAEVLRAEHSTDDDTLRRSLLRALASRRLHGEVLVGEFRLPSAAVGSALRKQVLARLSAIDRTSDARVSFRVAVRPPRGALHPFPLEPAEFLHGRRRARARGDGARVPSDRPREGRSQAGCGPWHVLGLHPGASADDVRRAYRRLARTVHPDLHPDATFEERRDLQARFVQITEAYRACRDDC